SLSRWSLRSLNMVLSRQALSGPPPIQVWDEHRLFLHSLPRCREPQQEGRILPLHEKPIDRAEELLRLLRVAHRQADARPPRVVEAEQVLLPLALDLEEAPEVSAHFLEWLRVSQEDAPGLTPGFANQRL